MNSAAFFAHPMLMYWLPTCRTLPLFSAAAMTPRLFPGVGHRLLDVDVLAGGEGVLRDLEVPVVGVAMATASISARERISV